MNRERAHRKGLFLLAVVAGVLVFFPESTRLTRLLTIAALVLLWAVALYIGWSRRGARVALFSVLLLAIMPFALPARTVDTAKLQADYRRGLLAFSNTSYVWGGESLVGIDCSGLARTGLVYGQFLCGLRTGNGALTRGALSLWWHDCSAKAMRDEYRGLTTRLFETDSINEAPRGRLQPGDLAVTASGVHVLIYLGDGRWIQADPGYGRVVTMTVPTEDLWFNLPVVMMRWRVLAG